MTISAYTTPTHLIFGTENICYSTKNQGRGLCVGGDMTILFFGSFWKFRKDRRDRSKFTQFLVEIPQYRPGLYMRGDPRHQPPECQNTIVFFMVIFSILCTWNLFPKILEYNHFWNYIFVDLWDQPPRTRLIGYPVPYQRAFGPKVIIKPYTPYNIIYIYYDIYPCSVIPP